MRCKACNVIMRHQSLFITRADGKEVLRELCNSCESLSAPSPSDMVPDVLLSDVESELEDALSFLGG